MNEIRNKVIYHTKSNKWCTFEQYFLKYDSTGEYKGQVPMIAIDKHTKEVHSGLMPVQSILNALREIEIVDNQTALDLLFEKQKKP